MLADRRPAVTVAFSKPFNAVSMMLKKRVAGAYPSAALRAAYPGTGEDGELHQRPIIEVTAGGVSRTEEALMGTTYVGARILLCDVGRGE
jgi:hypothetical protein